MNEELFDINNFNIIQDEENYYFFRALNMADNSDIKQGLTLSQDGKIGRIRTDRERFEGDTKYKEDSTISLEEVYDHIKIHYRKDTNCISLTSNSNVAINYGRGYYKDRYVMVKIPKKELGITTFFAGKYLLKELYSKIIQAVENLPQDRKQEIVEIFNNIENTTDSNTLKNIIQKKYSGKSEDLNRKKSHLRKGIVYSSPKSRISSYQSLNSEQLLEVNKIYSKLAILENEHILEHAIPHSSNSKLRETIGNAFSSAELIHYGDINKENIIEIPKEIVDIFALIQQIDGIEKNRMNELKQALLFSVQQGKPIPQITEITLQVKDSISIEEMYELTKGKVEYGKANSIVKNMFYLSKSRQNAIYLSNTLSQILGANSGFEDIINHIKQNGFRVEPPIISRQSGKGVKLSESVNLNLQNEERNLIAEIKKLSSDELSIIIQNGGFQNVQDIITKTFGNAKENEAIDKSRYYAEAIVSQYNWQNIGIEEFKIDERNELILRLQGKRCVELYESLKETGMEENKIPTVLFNIAMRDGFYEQYEKDNLEQLLNERQDVLENDISIEVVERFLGYYDIENTGIKLKNYQQKAYINVNRIFESKKFAQVILPTGAGKSFVALAQMQKYVVDHPNEKILYLAPQDEILNQIKHYIVKYLHGKQETVGKSEDTIIAEIFPNITFETYSGLLARRGQNIVNNEYGMIILDELHRTGATEWEGKVDNLLANQTDNVKILGITATPTRDVDGRDMANETAKKLGYTDEEINNRKHLASNMTLENAIKMGYVVNPKLVYCKYDLISSGKMDELKAKIDDIEDETKKTEELRKYNELRAKLNKEIDDEIGEEARKKLEDDARKNLDSGIGKEEILKQNVKKGGKYIVFIPVTDQGDIEDEDGNRISTKTGEDKILAYQEYLNKVFEGTEIVPQLHSLLGSYSKEKNKVELENFESDKSGTTKFMVVMNKANEGIHIEGVDGIIWFRALDENSRILYLQQLGRAIYALDEDNPLPDGKRPTVIDLANNSLTVKMEKEFENIEPLDDLEALIIVTEWINEHDGIIPDRNSSNKQEQHYYAILRRIKEKYAKYLYGFDEFVDLTDEDKSRIQEIIDLATEIDLWNMELPPIHKTRGNKEEFDPFTIEGVLRDFVEIEDRIADVKKESAMSTFVRVCESLSRQNFNFNNFIFTKQIEKDGKTTRVSKTIKDIQNEYPNIDITKVIEETGVTLAYSIGSAKATAVQAVQGKGTTLITNEEKQKLIQLGVVVLEKESAMSTFVRLCESLSRQNFNFDNFSFTKYIKKDGKKKKVSKTIEDIQNEYPNIDITKVIEETGVTTNYPIGNAKNTAVQAAQGKGAILITNEEKQKLIQLGVLNLEKESAMSTFVRVCESLSRQNFNFNSFSFTKQIEKNGKKKTVSKTIEDIQNEYPNIDITKVIEETGVTINYPIGTSKNQAGQAAQGKGHCLLTNKEKQKLIQVGVLNLEKESAMSTFVRLCESLSRQNFNFNNFIFTKQIKTKNGKNQTVYKTLEDIHQEYPEIDIERIIEETGVSLNYNIGTSKDTALGASKGRGTTLISKVEKQKLIKMGVINLEKESSVSVFVRVCESLNKQGVDFSKFVYTKAIIDEDGKKRYRVGKTLADIAQEFPNIDIDKVLEETGVESDYPIGSIKTRAMQSIKGTIDDMPITEEEKQKLIKMGVVKLEKDRTMSVFVRVCESLNKQGLDFSKFVYTKAIIDEDGKKRYGVGKTLADIAQEFPEIDIEKVIEETGVDLEYSINTGKHRVTKAFNGTVCEVDITEEEMKSLIDMGILSSKEKLLRARQQRDDAKSKNDKAKELELQVSEELVKRGKKYEEQ